MGDRGGGVGGGAVVPVAAKTRKRRAYLYIFNSVAAIASVLCVFVVNTVGTIRTIQILIGSDTNSTHSDDGLLHGYKAYYTPYLLREVLVAPATVQTRIDAEPAVHQLLCSRGFPFNAAPFDAVVIESVTDTGAWNTSVVSTGLQMVLQGFGGMYRGSQNEQANYKTFVWVLDPDPLQVVFNFHFAQVGRTKNSWAWGQALISGFLSFGVVTSTVCANILLRHDIFRAHCHVIAENQVDKTVIRVFRKDITLKQLFNLSLRPLA
ncbi:hypothetical protein DYB37_008140 [Aphanomyces astaci]|uniref:Uncharacterized protein n=1 Tax=Aphanomyces astaci TaxID=112090 RepID=A0A3R7CIG4_APHAT|nr:hypothetical protein DYB37_008140 [Aphanomyces astaci]